MLRTWKAHDAPIASMTFDPSGKLLLTGSADHTAKVWDVSKCYCTHNFKHSFGVVDLVAFSKTTKPLYAITCCDDQIVRVWDLYASKENQLVSELKGHLNSVTSLCVCDGGLLLTSSRDKTVILWDLATGKQLKTAVVYEAIESIRVIPPSFYPSLGISPSKPQSKPQSKSKKSTSPVSSSEFYIAMAGERGLIHIQRVFSTSNDGKSSWQLDDVLDSVNDNELVFFKREMEQTKAHNNAYYASLFILKSILVCEATSTLLGVTNSNNFKMYSVADCALTYQSTVIGNNDEIVDLCYVGDSNHLAVATNSYELRLLSIPTFSSNLLYGHRDTILSIKATADGKFILTSSKDKTVRLWHVPSQLCLVTCEGHLQDVSCCALSQRPHAIAKSLMGMIYRDALQNDCNHMYSATQRDQLLEDLMNDADALVAPEFWVSGSEDKTLKVWDLNAVSEGKLRGAKITVKAHDKSINAVCVAPNDKLVASCSMDKTIKLWSLPTLSPVMTLSGHKKGVWDISFSTLSSILLSCSGDQTLRVWNVKDGSTLYTIEGFDHSVSDEIATYSYSSYSSYTSFNTYCLLTF